MLSVEVDAVLVLPTGSDTRAAAMLAVTVPEVVMPLMLTLNVVPLNGAISVTVAVFVPPAVPPIVMFGFVIFLLFLLGWPFEWPAIILVFLPIFYPVVDSLKPALSQSFGIPPELFLVWLPCLGLGAIGFLVRRLKAAPAPTT